MFTQEFSLVVWLHVRPKNEPKKIVSADILGLSDRPKKYIRSSASRTGVEFTQTYAFAKNRSAMRTRVAYESIFNM